MAGVCRASSHLDCSRSPASRSLTRPSPSGGDRRPARRPTRRGVTTVSGLDNARRRQRLRFLPPLFSRSSLLPHIPSAGASEASDASPAACPPPFPAAAWARMRSRISSLRRSAAAAFSLALPVGTWPEAGDATAGPAGSRASAANAAAGSRARVARREGGAVARLRLGGGISGRRHPPRPGATVADGSLRHTRGGTDGCLPGTENEAL